MMLLGLSEFCQKFGHISSLIPYKNLETLKLWASTNTRLDWIQSFVHKGMQHVWIELNPTWILLYSHIEIKWLGHLF